MTVFLSWLDKSESNYLSDFANRGIVLCVGGPALVVYVSPTEEELFKVCTMVRQWISFISKLALIRDTTLNCKNGP